MVHSTSRQGIIPKVITFIIIHILGSIPVVVVLFPIGISSHNTEHTLNSAFPHSLKKTCSFSKLLSHFIPQLNETVFITSKSSKLPSQLSFGFILIHFGKINVTWAEICIFLCTKKIKMLQVVSHRLIHNTFQELCSVYVGYLWG